jgi:hypothetical protein
MPMHATVAQPQPWAATLVPIAVAALVIALRWRGMRQARPLRLGTLWLLPALYAVLAAAMFIERPPTPTGWGWCGAALVLGAGIGWQRGKMMRIAVDPATGALNQQGSPAALLLLLALMAVRQVARASFGGGHTAMLATGMALAFGLGLLTATRAEMALRARRLLAGAAA